MSLFGQKCVSSRRKPRHKNLGISSLCIRNHVVQSLWWRQVTCPFPGPCDRWAGSPFTYFFYCQSCSSKSSSSSVDCISASPSSPHQPFFLKSKKVPQNMETIWHLCWPPVRGVVAWLVDSVHVVGYIENVYGEINRVPSISVYYFSILLYYFPKPKNSLKDSVLRCLVLNSIIYFIFLKS